MKTTSDTLTRLLLVVDDNSVRIAAMVEALAVHTDMPTTVVDSGDGRVIDSRLMDICARPPHLRPTVVIVRARPTSWTAAGAISTLRRVLRAELLDVVLITEGPIWALPLRVADFPQLHLAPPHQDPMRVVLGLISGKTKIADPETATSPA